MSKKANNDNKDNKDLKVISSEEIDNLFDIPSASWLDDNFVFPNDARAPLDSNGKKRVKVLAMIVFFEDLPEELQEDDKWIQMLIDLGFRIAISPVHDSDLNANGTKKKKHRHIIMTAGGSNWISVTQIRDFVKKNFKGRGVPLPQKCSSATGAIRYFTHIDNPEKAQYKQSDIIVAGGFQDTVDKAFKRSDSEQMQLVKDVITIIRDNEEISDFFQVVDVALDKANNGDDTMFEVLNKSGWLVDKYISSRRYHMQQRAETQAKLKYQEQKEKVERMKNTSMKIEHGLRIQHMIEEYKDNEAFKKWLESKGEGWSPFDDE